MSCSRYIQIIWVLMTIAVFLLLRDCECVRSVSSSSNASVSISDAI